MIVNMHQAKTHLSRLIEDVLKGEEVIIGRAGRPVARLVAYTERSEPRAAGSLKGRIWISDDFDAPDDDLVAAFEGDT